MKTHLIIYVSDQKRSMSLFKNILKKEPVLDVPGMTEFFLNENTILGIMPEKGIKTLLGDCIEFPKNRKLIRSEIYIHVENPEKELNDAINAGARLLDQVKERNWDASVGYCVDYDGNIVAFAKNN